MDNNNNNNRAHAHTHETEICHCGRLGCWVMDDRAVRWGRCILEGVCFALLVFVFCALCAVV